MWVETNCGRTQGNWQYYAEADKRIKQIRDHFQKLKGPKPDKKLISKVEQAVEKITGLRRIDTDLGIATKGKKCPKGRHKPTWERDVFEEWFKDQPPEYGRILGSPRVIAAFIVEEK